MLCVVGPFKGESEPKVFLSRYLGDRRMAEEMNLKKKKKRFISNYKGQVVLPSLACLVSWTGGHRKACVWGVN